jgi:uncharacterized protein
MKLSRTRSLVYALMFLCTLIVVFPRWRQKVRMTGLIEAVSQGDEKSVARMLDAGADPNTVKKVRTSQISVLRIALREAGYFDERQQGYLDIARRLVDAGAKVNEPRVFSEVIGTHDKKTIQFFFDKGMKPHANGLNEAIVYGDLEIVRQVLALSPDLNRPQPQERLPLGEAVYAGYGDSTKYNTPVLIGKMLIERGAAVNPPGIGSGEVPLCYAASLGNVDFMELLHRHGAKVNVRAGHGWTPLHYAVLRKENVAAVKWLIAHGADVNAHNEADMTPLDWAKRSQLTEIVTLLKNAGAKEGVLLSSSQSSNAQGQSRMPLP